MECLQNKITQQLLILQNYVTMQCKFKNFVKLLNVKEDKYLAKVFPNIYIHGQIQIYFFKWIPIVQGLKLELHGLLDLVLQRVYEKIILIFVLYCYNVVVWILGGTKYKNY
jgi:hypothetical protein